MAPGVFAQRSLWVLLCRQLRVFSRPRATSLLLTQDSFVWMWLIPLVILLTLYMFLCPAAWRTAALWTSRWRRGARSQSRSLAKSALLWVAPTPPTCVSCSCYHATAIFVVFWEVILLRVYEFRSTNSITNTDLADMQYSSSQVIKGLSYLREKHKIMHRGQTLFHLYKYYVF